MQTKKIKHFMYVPFTGLGKFDGFRGNRWLKNRITVFKEYVIPSLQNQVDKDFTVWISWRHEERRNPYVLELMAYMKQIKEFKTIHTFHGVCFWDDKYPDEIAKSRLLTNLQGTMGELVNEVGECDYVLMTIQPSDDCYDSRAMHGFKEVFKSVPRLQALGFTKGYICNYSTKEVSEYNPKTTPPFFTIKFPRNIFVDPWKHAEYTGPYKSHEYVGDKLDFGTIEARGFLVGTHGENISTYYDHPYRGEARGQLILHDFGIYDSPVLKFELGWKRWLLKKLPHGARRRVRYIFTEKLYDFLRS